MLLDLIGAYNRYYNTPADVLKDWNDNKDFEIVGSGGTKINCEDAENESKTKDLILRFNYGKTKTFSVKLRKQS